MATLTYKLGMWTRLKTNYFDSLSALKMIKSEIPFGAVFILLGCLWCLVCDVFGTNCSLLIPIYLDNKLALFSLNDVS